MRKHIFGKQLQRDSNERKALFKSLLSSLIIWESIKTTEAKAKAVKGQFEKLITKARKADTHSQQQLSRYLSLPLMKKMITDIAPRFANRPGGYTRIIRLGNRVNDDAKMVMLELVEKVAESRISSHESGKNDVVIASEAKQSQQVMDAEIVPSTKKVKKSTAKKSAGKKGK